MLNSENMYVDNTNNGENNTVPTMATPNVVPKRTPVIAGHGEKP